MHLMLVAVAAILVVGVVAVVAITAVGRARSVRNDFAESEFRRVLDRALESCDLGLRSKEMELDAGRVREEPELPATPRFDGIEIPGIEAAEAIAAAARNNGQPVN